MKGFSEERDVRLLKEGNERAFERIFHSYYRPLTLFANKYVNDVEEAKEITQEFFIRFWSRQPMLKQGSLKTYLYRGVRNACLNHIEADKVEERRLQDYTSPLHTQDNVLGQMVLAEQEEEFIRAIDQLPAKCRQIFLMSRKQKLTYRSIADELGISLKTVESQMSIALRRLREILLSLSGFFLIFFDPF